MKYPDKPKAYSFKDIDSKSISEQIHKNSLDFLLKGVEQIEANPIQSVVNFWTGVELFIKALLVEEHWTLIAKDIRSITHDKFKNGDFVSIDFQHSVSAVENVFNIEFEKRTRKAFETLRKHRNKIVHFKNSEVKDKKAIEICDLFVEMSNVWNELRGLKLPVIDFDKTEIPSLYKKISNCIDNHKVILEGKYQLIFEEKLRHIDKEDLLKCSSCNYKAVVLSSVNDILFEAKCFVCNEITDVLKIKCEHCNFINLLQKPIESCQNCQEQLDLLPYVVSKTTSKSREVIATCHRCHSKSVIEFESFSFCLNCFSYHLDIAPCDSCGSFVTHSTKNSNIDGCICCDG